MNRYALSARWSPDRQTLHGVVQVSSDDGTSLYVLCGSVNASSLIRAEVDFSPKAPSACPGCVQVWKDSVAAKQHLCRECASPLPPTDPLFSTGVCQACTAAAEERRRASADAEHARFEEASRRASWLNGYQIDPRFPTVFCRSNLGHGSAQVGVTADATVVAMCHCGWAEVFPEDVQAVYVACAALAPTTLAILGILLPAAAPGAA